MGGIGKTTTARAVYEAIRDEFKVSCFLENIREVSDKNGLVHMQKELLSRLNIRSGYFYDLHDGKKTIQNSLCNKKVFLVLDDINEVSQLENLIGKQDWFGPGSRVIITTRDMHPLRTHGVHGTYEIKELVQHEALHLFCLKAFKRDQPKEGYLDLSKQVVKYTGGLPLALEVLGSYLCKRSIDVWHCALSKIRNVPHSKILDTLTLSYEGLDQMQKDMFLDIVCFFKGMKKDAVIAISKNYGHFPEIEIDVLIERSLVTIDKTTDELGMHDLLEEMGKHIVIQESPNDPGKRSRLWSAEDIHHVLIENKGTEEIQSIVARYCQYEVRWSNEAFYKTSRLKFLNIEGLGMQLPLRVNYLPSSLQVLHWSYFPLRTLPFTNQPHEVVDIKLKHSKIEQPWYGTKFFEKLKSMDLSDSRNLERLPDFSRVPNLETLLLWHCTSLTEVHPSLLCHKKLALLDLSGCKSLEALPSKLEMSSLKKLDLGGCSQLKNLPGFGECMEHLSELSLQRTAITELPTSLGCLVGLAKLNLRDCMKLVCLPDTICRLKSLKYLDITHCPKLCRLPEGIEKLKCLEELQAKFIGTRGLPLFVFKLENLRILTISDFSLCEGPTSNSLALFRPSFMDFQYDFSHLSSLVTLDLSGNNFVSLPCGISELPKLAYLCLNECRKLQSLPELPPSIRRLEACNCESLESSKFNPSKLCSLFASPVQPWQFPEDGDAVERVLANCKARFEMFITGSEIPSWFVPLPLPQENGFCAKIPIPHDWLRNERVGIVLCFQFVPDYSVFDKFECHLHTPHQLKPFEIKGTNIPFMGSNIPHLYFLYLSIDEFRDMIPKDGRWSEFQIETEYEGLTVRRSGYRLVYKENVEEWDEQSNDKMQEESKIFGAVIGLSQKRRRRM